jgi:hypothetical protein
MPATMKIKEKYCPKCKQTKHTDCFYKHKSRKDGLRAYCVECESIYQKGLILDRKNVNVWHRNNYIKNRDKVFNAYGGYKCCICGEDRKICLTIDHINNNGAEHRKKIGKNSKQLIGWIIRNNYPPLFQILCRNCNWIKYHHFREAGVDYESPLPTPYRPFQKDKGGKKSSIAGDFADEQEKSNPLPETGDGQAEKP